MRFKTMTPVIFYAGDTVSDTRLSPIPQTLLAHSFVVVQFVQLDVRGSFIEASKRSGFSPKEPPQLVCTFVRPPHPRIIFQAAFADPPPCPAPQVAQKNSRQYPYIKQIGDVALGVATQNMVIRK